MSLLLNKMHNKKAKIILKNLKEKKFKMKIFFNHVLVKSL